MLISTMNREITISVGGSTINPDGKIRTGFIKSFTTLVKESVDTSHQKTAIVTGGGKVSRDYQNALIDLGIRDTALLDTIGIIPTHIHAKLLAFALQHAGVNSQYLATLSERVDRSMDAWTTGGTIPGQTTDAVLVELSQKLGIRTILNATNIPYVFELTDGMPDPTKPIVDMTWREYLTLMGNREHQPGENLPFGITAARKAMELGQSVTIFDGSFDNLTQIFHGRATKGTTIHP